MSLTAPVLCSPQYVARTQHVLKSSIYRSHSLAAIERPTGQRAPISRWQPLDPLAAVTRYLP